MGEERRGEEGSGKQGQERRGAEGKRREEEGERGGEEGGRWPPNADSWIRPCV